MTLDAKTGADAPASKDQEETVPGSPTAYETPTLVPLGNVHALLAGGGLSVTLDGVAKLKRQLQ